MKLVRVATLCAVLIFTAGYSAQAEVSEKNIKSAVHKQVFPKIYKKVSGNIKIHKAMECLKGTSGDFSRRALIGENLTNKPIKVYFTNLATFNPRYSNYDALGMRRGNQLYIHLNQKHRNAPPEALAALLSHEALHQDKFNSINEETYAWTMEATVWHELTQKNPSLRKHTSHSLVRRENTISKMLENAQFSNRLIRNTVVTNPGYRGLPARSPGFENVQ